MRRPLSSSTRRRAKEVHIAILFAPKTPGYPLIQGDHVPKLRIQRPGSAVLPSRSRRGIWCAVPCEFMKPTHDVYLVPGFFGFANVGQLSYFGHVRRIVTRLFTERGIDTSIHIVQTPPTASLPCRAARVVETIAKTARRGRPIHLIGHSSGGLDVRLLAAPGVALPTAVNVEQLAARVRSVVTVSTPHHGTPIASFFTTLRGQKLLQVVSLNTIYVLQFGHLPLSALLWMGSVVVRFGDLVANSEILDEIFGRLLEDFSVGRRRTVRAMLRDVVSDQALMLQLTPEAMEVFNASVLRRPGVRYGAVVTTAPTPSLRSTLALGLDPAAQITHAIYAVLHQFIASTPPRDLPRVDRQQARALLRAYGVAPPEGANDGIVPTRSQSWGRVIHAAVADHLDTLGHFRDADSDPPHVDWLVSGSDFDRGRFEALWEDVVGFITADAPRRRRREGRVSISATVAGCRSHDASAMHVL
jgi:triacylglycerol lipase